MFSNVILILFISKCVYIFKNLRDKQTANTVLCDL